MRSVATLFLARLGLAICARGSTIHVFQHRRRSGFHLVAGAARTPLALVEWRLHRNRCGRTFDRYRATNIAAFWHLLGIVAIAGQQQFARYHTKREPTAIPSTPPRWQGALITVVTLCAWLVLSAWVSLSFNRAFTLATAMVIFRRAGVRGRAGAERKSLPLARTGDSRLHASDASPSWISGNWTASVARSVRSASGSFYSASDIFITDSTPSGTVCSEVGVQPTFAGSMSGMSSQ